MRVFANVDGCWTVGEAATMPERERRRSRFATMSRAWLFALSARLQLCSSSPLGLR